MGKENTNFMKLEEFKKKTKFNERLGLDDRDNTILSLVQNDPLVSQEEIAKKIKLSQPSVGARIRKLREKGILHTVNGVNFKVADLVLGKIDLITTNTVGILAEFRDCPFFVNALVTSGRYNLCLLFMATDLKRLEGIVNYHLRGNPKVKDVELNIVISTAKDLVLPLNLDLEKNKRGACGEKCLDYPLL